MNLLVTIVAIENKLTDACGNRLSPKNFMNTLCEISLDARTTEDRQDAGVKKKTFSSRSAVRSLVPDGERHMSVNSFCILVTS